MISQKQIKMIPDIKISSFRQYDYDTVQDEVGDDEFEIQSDELDSADIDEMQTDYEISQVSDNLQQATMDYLSVLTDGKEGEYLDEVFGGSDELEILIDRIEEILYSEFGIPIYRPRVVQDNDGVEHYVTSLAESEELMLE